MKSLLAMALVFACAGTASATFSSWGADVFEEDPAECTANATALPEVCVPGSEIGDALDDFGYWDYVSSVGNTTNFFIGSQTLGGELYMLMLSCEHCYGSPVQAVTLERGGWPDGGATYVPFDDNDNPGPYRQFNDARDTIPLPPYNTSGSGYLGTILSRYREAGDLDPFALPMMRVLQDFSDLREGTLMLTIGRGSTKVSKTLGWFSHCDDAGTGTCCTAARDSGQYTPFDGSGQNPSYPSASANRVGQGGEGNIAACISAGLEKNYMGPVWQSGSSGATSWATWRWTNFYRTTRTEPGTGVYVEDPSQVFNYTHNPGTPGTAKDRGECWAVGIEDGNAVWVVPSAWEPTNLLCWSNKAIGTLVSPLSGGDSGSIVFAYVYNVKTAANEWVLVGSAQNGLSGMLPTSLSKIYWDYWVHETTLGTPQCRD